jgi:hypothetical protein
MISPFYSFQNKLVKYYRNCKKKIVLCDRHMGCNSVKLWKLLKVTQIGPTFEKRLSLCLKVMPAKNWRAFL